jgi:ATP-dependent 26S proteasome regulatory subunit
MLIGQDKTLQTATLAEFTDCLIRGNGFGTESIWIKAFFNGRAFSTVEDQLDPYAHNIAQHVQSKFFEEHLGFKKILETFYDESGESNLTFENLEYEIGKYEQVYKKATVVYGKDDERICVNVIKYSDRDITYRLYSEAGKQATLQEWMTYAKRNNLYKGHKICADCSFLKLHEIGWDEVILDTGTIAVVQEQVSEMFAHSEALRANGITIKRGVILAGPPGTGKTLLCKVLAKEMIGTVIYAMPSNLEKTADIKRVCEMAKDLAPAMLIIEDIDYIAEQRDENRNAGMVMELMNYMDGIQDFNDIVTLATTNAQEKIEEAVKNRPGRFDRVVQIPKPTGSLRRKMIVSFTKRYDTSGLNITPLIKTTEDYSGAHIKHICESAAFKAIRAGHVTDTKQAIVTNEHFKEAMKDIDDEKFSSFHKAKGVIKKIGFDPDDF